MNSNKTSLYRLFTGVLLIGVLSGCTSSKTRIPVPESVSRGQASPWNFYEDFSAKSLSSYRLTKKFNRTDRSLYKFVEIDGDTALAITVKHGSHPNDARYGSFNTERAEVDMAFGKNARGKEVWWGFRVLASESFEAIDDRLLFGQMKHQHTYHGNPIIGIASFENMRIKFGGVTVATSPKSKDEDRYGVEYDYQTPTEELLNNPTLYKVTPKWRSKHDQATWYSSEMKPPYNKINWTTYVVGIYTNGDDSWVKVKQDGRDIYSYDGPIGDYNGYGRMNESVIRIGVYRDSSPNGEYPDQTLYFDDFTIASTENAVVNAMNQSCRLTSCKE